MVVSHISAEESSGYEISTDSEVYSMARSDIVEGLKVRVPSNPLSMAELGVSPRETGRPLLNFDAFDRDELKAMLQKDLEVIRDKMKAREILNVSEAPFTSQLQQSKKERGRKK
ncbi:hypothetical protein LguiA_008968 [Lonicera macranthoides]